MWAGMSRNISRRRHVLATLVTAFTSSLSRLEHAPIPVMETRTMNPDSTPTAQIRELERSYTDRVNRAVAEDRYDLVDELAASYAAELTALHETAA